jgi:hypothetical protein
LQNSPAYMSVPGRKFSFAGSVSNTNGLLRFSASKFYGKNNLVLQSDPAKNNKYTIDLLTPYSDKFSAIVTPVFSFSEKWKEELLDRSINMQVENTYLVEKKRKFLLPLMDDTTAFYGNPDKEYYLDDYTRFNTMEEVLREYVKEVRLRKQSDKFSFQVRDALFNIFFEDPPLILIDGVPVLDADKIVAMDPLKIKKIEIMSRKSYLGSVAANGIISYKTYEGDLAGYELDPNAIVVEYDGLQRQREFYSPVYNTPEQTKSRIPDYRNLLVWVPEIKSETGTEKKIVFYSSDLSGKFVISIQGITADGVPVSTLLNFTVKPSH